MSSLPSQFPVPEALSIEDAVALKIGEASQFLAAIVESSEDAIIGESLDGAITSWNRGAEKMFGYTPSEAIGQSVSILHSEGDAEELAAILDLIQQGKSASHFETKRRRKDKTRIDVSVSVSPVRNEEGQIIGVAKIIRDITDRKRSEELVRKTEKLAVVGRLAASVAHEINNPLSALTNLLYLLRREELSERALGLLSMAEHELARVSHITTQALGFYQENGSPSQHHISEIIDQAIAIHLHRIEIGSIVLEKQYEDSLPIVCHSGEIKQVFVNLIGNAIDAMSDGGLLRIRVRTAQNPSWVRAGVRVSIADTGCGISRETLKHLFEPFNTTKGDTRTGLGLWMCQQIVARHQGRIIIRSSQDEEKHGTVVTLYFPLFQQKSSDEMPQLNRLEQMSRN